MRFLEPAKDFADGILGPTTAFAAAVVGLAALILLRAWWSRPRTALAIAAMGIAAFFASLTDPDFAGNVTKPDNVAIVLLVAMLGFFLWLSFRKMVLNDELRGRGLPTLEERECRKQVFCWPDLIYTEFLVSIAVLIFLTVWSLAIPAPLEEPADPMKTPNPAKAPWYFLGLQEMLVYFDPAWAGVVIPSLIIVGLLAIPYIDPNPRGSGTYTFRERPLAIGIFLFGFLVLWILLILLGTISRGPGWQFYGPFESWDVQKAEASANINLSELFYVRLLGTPIPRTIFLRELPGIALVLLYLGALPPLLARFPFRGLRREMGLARFGIFVYLLLFLASLPIKMCLRWTLGLKYVVAVPEFFLNL